MAPPTGESARVYAVALVMPPLASLWLITAALLPRLWMTPEAFAAQHAPFHEIHLLGTLTLAIEPTLAYAMALLHRSHSLLCVVVKCTWLGAHCSRNQPVG